MTYNIIRLFSLSGTYVTVVVYGKTQYRVANFVAVRNKKDIQKMCEGIPKIANGERQTGKALLYMANAFADAPPGNPNILFVINQGPSVDSVVESSAMLRKYGIKTVAVGIGDKVDAKQQALIAFSSSLIFMSKTDSLVTTLKSIQNGCGKGMLVFIFHFLSDGSEVNSARLCRKIELKADFLSWQKPLAS